MLAIICVKLLMAAVQYLLRRGLKLQKQIAFSTIFLYMYCKAVLAHQLKEVEELRTAEKNC